MSDSTVTAADANDQPISEGDKVTYGEYPEETFTVRRIWQDGATIMLELEGEDSSVFDTADFTVEKV